MKRSKIISIAMILVLIVAMGTHAADICTVFTCDNNSMVDHAMSMPDTHKNMDAGHGDCDLDGNSTNCATSMTDFPALTLSVVGAPQSSIPFHPMASLNQAAAGCGQTQNPHPGEGFGPTTESSSTPLYLSHMTLLR